MSPNNKSVVNFLTTLSEIRVVTPEIAREWLQSNSYDRQRPVQKLHVAHLATQMRNGLFVKNTTIRFAKVGDTILLLDGQHRLNAVATSGIPMSFNVVVDEFPNDDDMAWAYGHTDVGKRRTNRDIYHALDLKSVLGFDGFTKRAWDSFCGAITLIKHRGRLASTSAHGSVRGGIETNVDLMKVYVSHAKQYYTILPPLRSKKVYEAFYNASVSAAALVTFRFAPDRAEQFWRKVVFPDTSKQTDVTTHLHTFVLSSPRSNYQDNLRLMHAIAHTWNKHCNGETLKQFKSPTDTTKEFSFKHVPPPAEWSKLSDLTPTAD